MQGAARAILQITATHDPVTRLDLSMERTNSNLSVKHIDHSATDKLCEQE